MPQMQAALVKNIAKAGSPLKTKGSLIITSEENSPTLPLDLLMVLDLSGSMSGAGVSVVTDSVIHVLNDLLRPDDRISVITFNNSARIHTGWTDVNGTVAPFSAGGGTNLGAEINEVLSFLGSHDMGGNRAGMVLFLSDGLSSGKPNDDNVRSIPDFGFTMHTIGVTNGANPTQLEHMAELARGHYFHAPTFDDVKKSFSSIFNLGKTIVYAAPELTIDVKSGCILSNMVQSPQGIKIEDNLGQGSHTVSLGHLHKSMRIELAFEVNVDNVKLGNDNTIASFQFQNVVSHLSVKGSDEPTEIYNAPLNQQVTLITQTARAATATKKGDMATATRAITKLEELGKTVPVATTRATTLTVATEATDIGTRLQTLGKIQASSDGATEIREG